MRPRVSRPAGPGLFGLWPEDCGSRCGSVLLNTKLCVRVFKEVPPGGDPALSWDSILHPTATRTLELGALCRSSVDNVLFAGDCSFDPSALNILRGTCFNIVGSQRSDSKLRVALLFSFFNYCETSSYGNFLILIPVSFVLHPRPLLRCTAVTGYCVLGSRLSVIMNRFSCFVVLLFQFHEKKQKDSIDARKLHFWGGATTVGPTFGPPSRPVTSWNGSSSCGFNG